MDSIAHLRLSNEVSINHYFRETNQATDFMAYQGNSSSSLIYWCCSNDIFSSIIRKDVVGWSYVGAMGPCLVCFSDKKINSDILTVVALLTYSYSLLYFL